MFNGARKLFHLLRDNFQKKGKGFHEITLNITKSKFLACSVRLCFHVEASTAFYQTLISFNLPFCSDYLISAGIREPFLRPLPLCELGEKIESQKINTFRADTFHCFSILRSLFATTGLWPWKGTTFRSYTTREQRSRTEKRLFFNKGEGMFVIPTN